MINKTNDIFSMLTEELNTVKLGNWENNSHLFFVKAKSDPNRDAGRDVYVVDIKLHARGQSKELINKTKDIFSILKEELNTVKLVKLENNSHLFLREGEIGS